MFFCFKKNLLPSLIMLLLTSNTLPAVTNIDDDLPDIGTTAGDTLSINQEIAIGDFYMRQLRDSALIINDPLLNQYVNNLGQKLVSHSRSVKMPFHFFIIQHDAINAFTLFGGNIVVNSVLFHYVDNESQLASIIAHEISHVTQRHLARAIEYQKHNNPFTWFNALSSIVLAIASPQVGMAALTGVLAGAQQERISFTQQNEQEADRIGIQILQRAGFDPEAMPDFLKKLVDESRFASKAPEILLTHPLPDSRLADVRNRVNQMKQIFVPSSQDFYMAKVRVIGMFSTGQNRLNNDLLIPFSHGNNYEKVAAQYGRALVIVSEKKFAEARAIVAPLLAKQPNNIWYLDLMTDIDIGLKQPQQAINRLQAMKNIKSMPALQINLANAYMEARQPAHASKLLYRYTWANKDDPNGWKLLMQASAAQNLTDEEEAAHAESLALVGQLDQAIRSLSIASATVPLGSLKQARYDARIDQLRQLQQRFSQYKNNSKGFPR